jgi:hypothetical protein
MFPIQYYIYDAREALSRKLGGMSVGTSMMPAIGDRANRTALRVVLTRFVSALSEPATRQPCWLAK